MNSAPVYLLRGFLARYNSMNGHCMDLLEKRVSRMF